MAICTKTTKVDNMKLSSEVDRILGRSIDGHAPSREDCVQLLRLPSDSFEARSLMAVADTVSRRRFGHEAMLLGQIGIKTAPCPGDCGFCVFGESHTQIPGDTLAVEEILMRPILDEIEHSDAIVLASPMNFGTVTAVMKRFIERLVCCAYWPWGKLAPSTRKRERTKLAVVVASSAAPAMLARLFTSMVGLLKQAARLLGAKRVDVLFIGLAALEERPDIGDKVRRKAQRLGRKLAEHRCR